MLLVTISCARSEGAPCPQLLVKADTADALPGAVTAQLADAKWTVKDGEQYCPHHNPADAGEPLEVGSRYAPIRDTGWEIRVPSSPFADPGRTWLLEVRRTSDGGEDRCRAAIDEALAYLPHTIAVGAEPTDLAARVNGVRDVLSKAVAQ